MKPDKIIKRFDSLRSLRKTLDGALQQIQEYVVPFRGEFYQDLMSEHQVDWFRREIYDATAPNSANMLASQMHGNLTTPTIRWFALGFRNKKGMENDQAAKEWLEEVQERVWQAIVESNFDTEAAEMYLDITSLGTSHLMQEPVSDLEWKGQNFTAMPMMDCYFENGADGGVLKFYRVLRWSLLEINDRFPQADLDAEVSKNSGDDKDGSVERRYDIIFCIYRRDDKQDADVDTPLAPDQRPFGYKYIMRKGAVELEEGGYFEMPARVIRWMKTAGSRWGYSPAHVLLSDIKQINDTVAQLTEARAKAIDPPYMTTERGVIGDLNLVAGGLTLVTNMEFLKPLENATQWAEGDKDIERLGNNIKQGFYIDRLDLKESPAMTATEVQARYERMMRLLSPVLGRLTTDFLDPVIEGTYAILSRQGQLPEMPKSADGEEMDIEYIGPLPRAQKGEVSQGIAAWLGDILAMAEAHPEALDVPDWDQTIRIQAELRGVPTRALMSVDEIRELRDARAEETRQAKEAEAIRLGGEAAQAAGEGAQAVQAAGGDPAQLQAVS